MSLPIITYNTIRLCCWLRQYFKGQILKLTFENAVHELTFKVQLLKPVLWLLFLFFFRWESPPNISGPSSSAWLRWWRTFCCSSVLSLLSCWHSLQVYPTSSIWLQVLIYCSDSILVRTCTCGYVYAIACGNEYESADVQNCYHFAHLQTCIAEECVRYSCRSGKMCAMCGCSPNPRSLEFAVMTTVHAPL